MHSGTFSRSLFLVQKASFINRQSHKILKWKDKMNFDFIYSTLKSFSKRTCRPVHDYIKCAIGKTVLWTCDEHNYLRFCTNWSFVCRYMITLIQKYRMYNLSKSLPIPCSYSHPSLSLTWSETVRKGLLATSLVIWKSESCNATDTFAVLRNSNLRSRATILCGKAKRFSLSPPVHKAFRSSLKTTA